MKKIIAVILILSAGFLYGQTLNNRVRISCRHSIDGSLSFRGIAAINGQTAWVSGGKGSVYRTTNGGDTWEKVEVPGSADLDFRDIQILAENTVLLMSAGLGDKSRIYQSVDRGKTWAVKFQSLRPDVFLDAMAFWDDQNGLVVGDPIDGRLFVIITRDGGYSWQEINPEHLPKALPGESAFAASGACIAVNGGRNAWIGLGGPAARVFQTADRGNTWAVFETPISSGNTSSGIFSIYFRNKTEGIAVGGDYKKPDDPSRTMASTRDGGKTWKLEESHPIPFQSCLGEVHLHGKTVLVSTGPAGTYFSDDGRSWAIATREGFHCLSVSGQDGSVWLAGSEGRVAKMDISMTGGTAH